MMSLLFPYFIMAVCISGQGMIEPPRTFGPFYTLDDAHGVVSFLAYGYLCESRQPERKWRWTTAIPINIPREDRP